METNNEKLFTSIVDKRKNEAEERRVQRQRIADEQCKYCEDFVKRNAWLENYGIYFRICYSKDETYDTGVLFPLICIHNQPAYIQFTNTGEMYSHCMFFGDPPMGRHTTEEEWIKRLAERINVH